VCDRGEVREKRREEGRDEGREWRLGVELRHNDAHTHTHRLPSSSHFDGTWLQTNCGIKLMHNCCFLIAALQILYYNPSTADWLRTIVPWLARHGRVQSVALARVRALSNMLTEMGRGNTSWPHQLYRMLMLAGLVNYVAQLNDVQES
jgi:hypothetical protein